MKRLHKATLILLCCLLVTLVLGACTQTQVTATFSPNYDGAGSKLSQIKSVGATVTPPMLTRTGYDFDGWYLDADCATAATDADFTVTSDVTFYAKWSSVLTAIFVEYTGGSLLVGDQLDLSKLAVTATYYDESSREIADYTLSATSFDSAGAQTVTVTYTERGVTQTATFNVIAVEPVYLTSITASYNGDSVLVGEQPDVSDLRVTAHYSNGTSKNVSNFNVGTIDSATEGDKQWEISYTEDGVTKTTYVTITVIAEQQAGEPQEKDYNVNVIANEQLSIHFLELGNKFTGDSVYIKAGNVDILIDAGSRYDSATTITNYVDKFCDDGILEYVIVSHAHQDHIAGFYGDGRSTGIFDHYVCNNIIEFARTNATTVVYSNYQNKRNAEKAAGANVYTALECVNNSNGAQKVYDLTGDGSITMEILYQEYYEKKASNENNYSVCMMLNQGDNHYLFTGDLESEGEASLVKNNPNMPEVELWKGGHHGSYTAASTTLMSKIKPKCVCICTCMGTSEYTTGANAFPAQEFCNRIAPYTDRVYVTTDGTAYSFGVYKSANGNIVFACTNKQITMYFSNNNLKLKDTAWFKANRTMPSAWR